MSPRRIDRVLGNVVDDGGDERIAEFARDALGGRAHDVAMLAEDRVRAVLLHAGGGHDRRREAGSERGTRLFPRELAEPDGLR